MLRRTLPACVCLAQASLLLDMQDSELAAAALSDTREAIDCCAAQFAAITVDWTQLMRMLSNFEVRDTRSAGSPARTDASQHDVAPLTLRCVMHGLRVELPRLTMCSMAVQASAAVDAIRWGCVAAALGAEPFLPEALQPQLVSALAEAIDTAPVQATPSLFACIRFVHSQVLPLFTTSRATAPTNAVSTAGDAQIHTGCKGKPEFCAKSLMSGQRDSGLPSAGHCFRRPARVQSAPAWHVTQRRCGRWCGRRGRRRRTHGAAVTPSWCPVSRTHCCSRLHSRSAMSLTPGALFFNNKGKFVTGVPYRYHTSKVIAGALATV